MRADRDRGIQFGETEIDLTHVEQLVEASQTRAIMDGLAYLGRVCRGRMDINSLLDRLDADMDKDGGGD